MTINLLNNILLISEYTLYSMECYAVYVCLVYVIGHFDQQIES